MRDHQATMTNFAKTLEISVEAMRRPYCQKHRGWYTIRFRVLSQISLQYYNWICCFLLELLIFRFAGAAQTCQHDCRRSVMKGSVGAAVAVQHCLCRHMTQLDIHGRAGSGWQVWVTCNGEELHLKVLSHSRRTQGSKRSTTQATQGLVERWLQVGWQLIQSVHFVPNCQPTFNQRSTNLQVGWKLVESWWKVHTLNQLSTNFQPTFKHGCFLQLCLSDRHDLYQVRLVQSHAMFWQRHSWLSACTIHPLWCFFT